MNRTQRDDIFHGEPISIKEKSCKPEAHYGRVGIIDLCVLIVANVLNQEIAFKVSGYGLVVGPNDETKGSA